MKRILIYIGLCLLSILELRADEGMWLIHNLKPIYEQMKERGLLLDLEAIYHPDSVSLADAVVMIDGGVGTGSMISDRGLMITNHHVAYSDICALSTPQHNYLEQGFWAKTPEEEIPVKGKTVGFLRGVKDVTDEVVALKNQMKQQGRWGVMSMRRLYADLERRYAQTSPYTPSCVGLWHGTKYYMYFYEVFRDVRLVGVPPVTIGAFGGESDNWSWPQHKGDFALYRIYGSREGKPQDYAEDNIPIKPRKVLQISQNGIHDGDFACVVGFPGRTHRYTSSYGIIERHEVRNPIVVEQRHKRMDILRRRMSLDDTVRLKYSDAFFSLANFADLAKWESECLERFSVVEKRQKEEACLSEWIASDSSLQRQYPDLMLRLEKGYDERREAERNLNYFRETWLGPVQALLLANRISSYAARLKREGVDTILRGGKHALHFQAMAHPLSQDYDAETDRELFIVMSHEFAKHVPPTMWGEGFHSLLTQADGDVSKMAARAFDHSFVTTEKDCVAFFDKDRTLDEILADPLVCLTSSVKIQRFTGAVSEAEKRSISPIRDCEKNYTQALYAYRLSHGQILYPDANSTMRLSYGVVRGLPKQKGAARKARSESQGFLKKHDPSHYEFRVENRMLDLLHAKKWGRWAEDGTLYVNFLSDNDITGGNSGSPVLDAEGRLIGLAFDGNRESMAGDLYFEESSARTVSVDIRFVMWVIEQYAQADYLMRELGF